MSFRAKPRNPDDASFAMPIQGVLSIMRVPPFLAMRNGHHEVGKSVTKEKQ
jgi:hypothetical protein